MYKTHTLVKWRTNVYEPFRNFTKIPISFLKNYIGPVVPIPGQEVKFTIVDPIPQILQPLMGSANQILLLKMTEHFYLISHDTILVFNPNYPVALLTTENITNFKIGNNPWQPISNVVFYNQFCIVSVDKQIFSVVGGQNQAVRFVLPEEIEKEKLNEIGLDEFCELIKVRNYILI